jgi:hypothetical protein
MHVCLVIQRQTSRYLMRHWYQLPIAGLDQLPIAGLDQLPVAGLNQLPVGSLLAELGVGLLAQLAVVGLLLVLGEILTLLFDGVFQFFFGVFP